MSYEHWCSRKTKGQWPFILNLSNPLEICNHRFSWTISLVFDKHIHFNCLIFMMFRFMSKQFSNWTVPGNLSTFTDLVGVIIENKFYFHPNRFVWLIIDLMGACKWDIVGLCYKFASCSPGGNCVSSVVHGKAELKCCKRVLQAKTVCSMSLTTWRQQCLFITLFEQAASARRYHSRLRRLVYQWRIWELLTDNFYNWNCEYPLATIHLGSQLPAHWPSWISHFILRCHVKHNYKEKTQK